MVCSWVVDRTTVVVVGIVEVVNIGVVVARKHNANLITVFLTCIQ